jgi:nitrite reductase (NO-forming)
VNLANADGRRGWLDERRVLRLGTGLAAGFVAAAIVAFATPAVGQGHWAGIHLSLAGAALVAVGTFLPHFAVTLAGTRPEPPILRLAGVLGLATGASLAVAGILAGLPALTIGGALLLWTGIGITAWAAFRPRREPLARRHPLVRVAYGGALAQVGVGIALPVLLVAGWQPAAASWLQLKVAHVWLNLFGFISLTIAATLVYLYPTILGARIRAHPGLPLLVIGAFAGPPLVATGAILGSDPVGIAGGGLSLVGSAGLAAYVLDVWRRRGTWTTDPGWHRLSAGHLTAGVGWFGAATAAALSGLLRDGIAPAGWSLGALAMPLVFGWAVQVLVGSWTHLLPAVAVTLPERRAAMRATLGRAATARLVAWNLGVAVAWGGLAAQTLPLALAGIACFSLAALAAVALALASLLRRDR